MRGRKPTPTILKMVKGNPGHRPMPADEPRPPAAIPKCPKHLDKHAKKEWRRMAKELEPLGLLTKLDKSVFAIYCQAYSTWAMASQKIEEMGMVKFTVGRKRTLKNGDVVESGGGLPVVNPYLKIQKEAIATMNKAMIEMGMTPSSRSRVKVAPQKQEKPNEKGRFFK